MAGRADQWGKAWGLPGLTSEASIDYSKRLRTSLGRCSPTRGIIRLHQALRDAPQELQDEVLCHELAHFAAFKLHGPAIRPHGPEWKALMRQAGFEPRARLPQPPGLELGPRRRPRRYRHRCPVCGAQRIGLRVVRAWRCRACSEAGLDGRLEIHNLGPVKVRYA